MSLFHDLFERVYVINLDRRKDRWDETVRELTTNGVQLFHRWAGYDSPKDGHYGCTRSHRELLAKVADSAQTHVLVMEDDVMAITPARLKEAGFNPSQQVWRTHHGILNGAGNLVERFEAMRGYLPRQWDVLYLGAGYGEPPISRLNSHVIRCGFMQTTSSYAISREYARKWTDAVNARYPTLDHHPGQIDNLFGSFAHDNLSYCLQPRLTYQRASKSDITGETHSYLFSMTDPVHESMV